MHSEEQLATARRAIRESLEYSRANSYTTNGRAWRQIIASLAFETQVDLSLIQYFEEYEQARFYTITQAFMDGVIPLGDIRDLYLEFYPKPRGWKDNEGLLGGPDEG